MIDLVVLNDEEGSETLEIVRSPHEGFVRLKIIDSIYRICDVNPQELMTALIKISHDIK